MAQNTIKTVVTFRKSASAMCHVKLSRTDTEQHDPDSSDQDMEVQQGRPVANVMKVV